LSLHGLLLHHFTVSDTWGVWFLWINIGSTSKSRQLDGRHPDPRSCNIEPRAIVLRLIFETIYEHGEPLLAGRYASDLGTNGLDHHYSHEAMMQHLGRFLMFAHGKKLVVMTGEWVALLTPRYFAFVFPSRDKYIHGHHK
jgi:hypothetical protein